MEKLSNVGNNIVGSEIIKISQQIKEIAKKLYKTWNMGGEKVFQKVTLEDFLKLFFVSF